ncbi:N-acyl-D-amino-acid deacylase family protein [Sphaerochaeta sp.]|uniref:N-acyl-D-amino-acid deacylase family protein n=1 Tax=Sphaerochaeta sp. TaxID=1972642 RepID=UPI002FCC75E2
MFVFSNATVVDGTGGAPFTADIQIENDQITAILPPETSRFPVDYDCTGKVLCPGFIDMHGHSELEVLRNPSMRPKIGQGITTEVTGNCGIGVFPAEKDSAFLKELCTDVLGPYEAIGWNDFSSYCATWKQQGSGTNMAFLQAHATLRSFAMEGSPNRIATLEEVQTMCSLLQASLESGCLGMSTGLYYAPCLFADRKELLSLLALLQRNDRLFTVHIRCEGDGVLTSLQEVLELARETGVRLQISHLKAIGRENQQLVGQMLSMIEEARLEGLDVHFDQYPYAYGSTSLFSLLPPPYLRLSRSDLQQMLSSEKERQRIKQHMEEARGWDSIAVLCGWDAIKVLTLETNPRYEGMSIAEVASERGQGPYDAFFDLLKEEKGSALMTDVTQSQESIKRILSHPLMCFGTDALYAGRNTHPRSYQAAIHLLDRYWKQQHVLPLEQLIAKMTGACALRLNIPDRGTIKPGCKADIVVFDPKTLQDCSSDQVPDAKAKGLDLVMVNGNVAYREGSYTDTTAGDLLLY